jgi:prepilin peptidase CpaA
MGKGQLILVACVVVFSAIGLVCDLKTRKLPNVLTVPALCLGVLFHLSPLGMGWFFTLTGFVVGFCVMLTLWLVGGSGGGDVKFMGAIGAWLGPWTTFQVLIIGAGISLLLTATGLGRRLVRMKLLGAHPERAPSKAAKKRGSTWIRRLQSGEEWVVPFGVSAALATWIVLAMQIAGYALPWPTMMGY